MHVVKRITDHLAKKRITVILADDHKGVREGYRCLLEEGGKVEVLAEARNGFEAITMVDQLHPAVVLMDIGMAKLNGMEATRRIILVHPATRILMLSAHDDDAYVDQAMAVGASGYLLKQGAANHLTTAIQAVAKGNTYFSPVISKRLKERKSFDLATQLEAKKHTRGGTNQSLNNEKP